MTGKSRSQDLEPHSPESQNANPVRSLLTLVQSAQSEPSTTLYDADAASMNVRRRDGRTVPLVHGARGGILQVAQYAVRPVRAGGNSATSKAGRGDRCFVDKTDDGAVERFDALKKIEDRK